MPSISECRQPYLLSNLRLGHRVVDVDRREEQRAGLLHLVEPVHAGGGLLGDALDAGGDPGPALAVLGQRAAQHVEDDARTPRSRPSDVDGTAPAASNSAPLCTSRVASPPSSRIMLGPPPSGQSSTCSVHHQYSGERLALPGVDRDTRPAPPACRPGRPTTAAAAWSWVEKMLQDAQRTCGAERDQRLDQHRGLDRHVQRAGDPGAAQRLGLGVLARGSPSARASRARRAGSPCGRRRRATGRRP